MENKIYNTNYYTAVNWLNGSMVLCNDIASVDEHLFDEIYGEYEKEEDDELEVFSYFITNYDKSNVEYITEHFPGVLFAYSNLLNVFVLLVTHQGTGWKHVEWHTDMQKAERESGQD